MKEAHFFGYSDLKSPNITLVLLLVADAAGVSLLLMYAFLSPTCTITAAAATQTMSGLWQAEVCPQRPKALHQIDREPKT